jgi:hypothetical protein
MNCVSSSFVLHEDNIKLHEKLHKDKLYGSIKSKNNTELQTDFIHMSAIYIHKTNLLIKLMLDTSSIYGLAINQSIQNIYKSLNCKYDTNDLSEITVKINHNAYINIYPSLKSKQKEFVIYNENSDATKFTIINMFPALKYKNNMFKVVIKCLLNFNYTVTPDNTVFININTSNIFIKYDKTPLLEKTD